MGEEESGMIRLRIERLSDAEIATVTERPVGHNDGVDGLIWFEYGLPIGRVIIEQYDESDMWCPANPEDNWVPIEVIDES